MDARILLLMINFQTKLDMKNILVPTDFSEYANAASEYAIKLAKLAGAKIQFVHLQSTPVNWIKLSKEKEMKYPDALKAIGRSRSELNGWVKKAKAHGVEAEQAVIFDAMNNQLIDHVKQHNHDFIVMGSHGLSGTLKKVIGSNTQQILRSVEVPLLILKKPIPKPIKKILFVSDFTDVSKMSFHSLTSFADVLEAHIDLLFINTPDDFKVSTEILKNMDALMEHCHREESCDKNVANAASIEDGIKGFVTNNSVDLIAICTHGKGALRQLFSPSIAEKVVEISETPILSIKL
jgi:nucleotide-binding universal stress UspA family protein